MRQPRLKAPANTPVAFYHCISRVVDRQFLFGPEEKEKFISLMDEYSNFCGVRVLSFCIMNNHFHVFVEVPKRPERLMGHEWLLERLDALTVGYPIASSIRQRIDKFLKEGALEPLQQLIKRFAALMWDVSPFMKLVKQRFSRWYNRKHDRHGTLWEERFKSNLIEGAGSALAAIAAYIDLNPVRAEIVSDPADYEWSSYGKACEGDDKAVEAIRTLVAGAHRMEVEALTAGEGMKVYRGLLVGNSSKDAKADGDSARVPLGPTKEEVLEKVLSNKRVSMVEFLQIRVRYFTDGAVLGSKEFVEDIFHELRGRFGPKRAKGGSRVKGLESKDNLFSMRNLQKRLFG